MAFLTKLFADLLADIAAYREAIEGGVGDAGRADAG